MKKWGKQTLSAIDIGFSYIVILISVIAFFTFGAVTWVDTRSYIDIARELHGPEDVLRFFSGSRIWYHNYVPLGLPLQWHLLEHLPVDLVWPVVTLTNRAFAAFALIYLTRSLQHVYPSPLLPLAGVMIALHPFYQAFQNAFLTETPAMGLLALGLGVAIRRVYVPERSQGWFVALLFIIACAVFFRANVALILICVALAVLFQIGRLFRLSTALPFAVFLALFLSYPLYVSHLRGELILPRIGLSALVEGIRINPDPSEEAKAKAKANLPPGEFDLLLSLGADWNSALAVAEQMKASGLSNLEILDRVEAAGAALREDTWLVEMRAWLIAGSAVGLPLDCRLAPSSYFSMRDLPVDEYCRLYFAWYDFHTWVGPRTEIHTLWMQDFFSVEGREDLARYEQAWTPYVHERAIFLRDPLFLRVIPVDIIALAFLISSAILLFRLPWLGCVLIGIFVGNWIMYASVPFGGARYAYPLFPIYVFAIPLAYLARRTERLRLPHLYLWERFFQNLPGRRTG